jgi:hypothetical protein
MIAPIDIIKDKIPLNKVNFAEIGTIQNDSVRIDKPGISTSKKSFLVKVANESAIEEGTIEIKKENKET